MTRPDKRSTTAPAAALSDAAPARPSRGLVAGLTAFVLAFGAAGYAWLGQPQGLAVAPGMTGPAEAGAPALDPARIAAMVAQLNDRVKAQPDDADAWEMLGRTQGALGRFAEAAQAYAKLVALRPQSAQAHADYAEVLALSKDHQLEGQPEALIKQALALDPDNAKALAFAGSLAFNRGNTAEAAQAWERALRNTAPGSEMAQELQSALNELRPTSQANAAQANAAPAAKAPVAASPGASVRVRITLSPALAAQAAPDDTVFVFARALQGPKAPLAIQRRQVKDLPLDLTLDDSMAMNPALRLSSVPQVVIGARISKSGNAMPQPGDLQAISPAVAVGAQDVTLQIADVVR